MSNRPPQAVFDPEFDPELIVSLVEAAADAVVADIGDVNDPFARRALDKREIERTKDDLGDYAQHLLKLLDRISDPKDRAFARSALAHVICGTFNIAHCGVYPDDELVRAAHAKSADMRKRKAVKATKRGKIIERTMKNVRRSRKQMLPVVNAALKAAGEKQIKIGTLYAFQAKAKKFFSS